MSVFFKPEIQIIKYNNIDVISTSGDHVESFFYNGYVGSSAGITENDFARPASITPEMLSAFKRDVPITSPRVWYTYNYDTNSWTIGRVY